jgi:hypothetical protein
MYKIKLMKLQEEYKELLIDYLSYNEIFYKKFGVFTGKKNSKELAKEIINRFYSNLVSLGNYLLTKDSLGATLIQRYNHELVIDFYYLLNPGGEKDKVEKFFNYDSKSIHREWSSFKKKQKEDFVPPWVADRRGYKFEAKEEFAILHHNYETIDEFMSKLPRYAKAEAREKQEKNEPFTLSIAVKNAISEFMGRFFSSEGFKDGMHGFALSVLQMFYCFLVYFYYWELKKYPEMTTKELTESTDEFFKQGLYETKFWKDRHNLSDALNKLKMKIVKRL